MKKVSGFYTSLGLLIILNLIIKPVWIFVIDRGVQNEVGPIEYGQYFSLFNLSVILGFILDLGLTNYFNRQLAANPDFIISQTGNFFLLKIILVFIYSLLLIVVAYVSGIKRWDIVTGVLLSQVFIFLFVFARAIITGHQWFQTDAWLSVLDKALMIVWCSGFLFIPALFGNITINHFLVFQVISTLLAVIVTFIILIRRGVSFKLVSFPTFLNRKLLVDIFPFMLILLLMSAHNRLDGFLLERLHANGAYETGVYAASYRLLDAANMIGVLFASFILPFISKYWKSNNDINSIILNIRHALISFSILVVCTFTFLSTWIHGLLYTYSDTYSSDVLKLCMPALIGYTLVCIYGTVMTATGHLYPFCKIVFMAFIANALLNMILIPSFGAKACCFAAIISQAGCGVMTMIYSSIKLNIKLHVKSLSVYIFMAVLLTGFLFMAKELSLGPWLTILLASLLMILLVFSTRLFIFRNWKQLFNLIQ